MSVDDTTVKALEANVYKVLTLLLPPTRRRGREGDLVLHNVNNSCKVCRMYFEPPALEEREVCL